MDAGGNITLIADGTGNVDIFAPPASESSSITVNGVAFNTAFRVNDIGTSAPAQSIIHRHSTTLEPVLLYARANSDTDAHAAVTNGMPLSSAYTSGWTGTQYSLFGQVRISADATGTISDTSAPGKLDLMVSPDGSITPVSALSINNAGLVSIGNLGFTGNTISSTDTYGNINLMPDGDGSGEGTVSIGQVNTQVTYTGAASQLQIVNTPSDFNFPRLGIFTYTNGGTVYTPALLLGTSAAANPSANAAVSTNDVIGQILIGADDGTNLRTNLTGITSTVTGAVSTGIIPTDLKFYTTNTSGIPTLGMTISNAQVVTLANALPVGSGGTGLTSYTANNLIYASGTSTLAGLATANNGLLVTNGSGVPSIGNSIGASISVTGSVTATTGITTGISGTNSGTNKINTSNPSGTAYTITKSSSASRPPITRSPTTSTSSANLITICSCRGSNISFNVAACTTTCSSIRSQSRSRPSSATTSTYSYEVGAGGAGGGVFPSHDPPSPPLPVFADASSPVKPFGPPPPAPAKELLPPIPPDAVNDAAFEFELINTPAPPEAPVTDAP